MREELSKFKDDCIPIVRKINGQESDLVATTAQMR
jgi:hypothetical protein